MNKLVSRIHVVEDLEKRCPYYAIAPKDLAGNLRFRAKLLSDARDSESVRKDLWRMCKRDILFWFAAFAWTLDPRLPAKIRKIPFIPYPFQEFCILDLLDSIMTGTSRAIQKCRDIGMSWMCVGVTYHQWQFSEHFRAGFSSRNEKLVVNSMDDDAVFSRLDFIKRNQPPWMVPDHTPFEGRWRNNDLGGSLSGESTTGNMFRAGRFTVADMDEYAHFTPQMADDADKASANVTETRWFVSTPNGRANSFFKKCNPKKNDPFAPVVRRYQWTEHPGHVKGLYRSENGRLEIIDKDYKFPKDYQFVLDGKVRSVWYDKKSAELDHDKRKIGEELDGDFAASGNPVFSYDDICTIVGKTCKPPLHIGTLLLKDPDLGEPGDFVDEEFGKWRMWVNLDVYGRIEKWRRCVMGIDVSKGRHASYDALCIWDRDTREKLAQYVDNDLGDYALAPVAVAAARLFNNAEMIWEQNGGVTFGKHVVDIGYLNFYTRKTSEESMSGGSITDVPGWYSSSAYKESALKSYFYAMLNGRAFNRDEYSVRECAKFVKVAGGVAHEEVAGKPGLARSGHGDVVIADMLAWFKICTYGKAETKQKEYDEITVLDRALKDPNPPVGTAMWRRQQNLERARTERFGRALRESSAVF